MTCIVAVKHGDQITMGADSAITGRFISTLGEGTAKIAVRKLNGNENFIIGAAGKGQIIQLAVYGPTIPKPPESNAIDDMMGWLVNDVCGAIQLLMKPEGTAQKDDTTQLPGELLLGIRGRLYKIHSNLLILPFRENYAAIGSGSAHALGVMFANERKSPKKRLEQALQAAEHWNPDVRRPFVYKTLG